MSDTQANTYCTYKNKKYLYYNNFYVLCLKLYFYVGTPDILNTTPDEHNLLKLLANIDHQWYVIGKALKVSHNVLSGLQTSREENKVKLIQIIYTWLTTQPSPVTWKTVISAIEGSIVGNLAKANEIRDHLGLPRCQ